MTEVPASVPRAIAPDWAASFWFLTGLLKTTAPPRSVLTEIIPRFSWYRGGYRVRLVRERVGSVTHIAQPDMRGSGVDRRRVGTELRRFGEQFGGVDLEVRRDPAPIEPVSFE